MPDHTQHLPAYIPQRFRRMLDSELYMRMSQIERECKASCNPEQLVADPWPELGQEYAICKHIALSRPGYAHPAPKY